MSKQKTIDVRRAYYYTIEGTGQDCIDRIALAINTAGKCFHATEEWADEADPQDDNLTGSIPLDWIQNAINAAAKEIQKLREEKEHKEKMDPIWNNVFTKALLELSDVKAENERLRKVINEHKVILSIPLLVGKNTLQQNIELKAENVSLVLRLGKEGNRSWDRKIKLDKAQKENETLRKENVKMAGQLASANVDKDDAIRVLKKYHWKEREYYRGLDCDIFCICCDNAKDVGDTPDCELNRIIEGRKRTIRIEKKS